MYKLTATTENIAILGHAVNIDGWLTDTYMSIDEANSRIPSVIADLHDLGGYGEAILKEIEITATEA